MKRRFFLHKFCLLLLMVMLGSGVLMMEKRAFAETLGDVRMAYAGYDWDEDYFGVIEEDESVSDYVNAIRILDEALENSGQQFNQRQKLYDLCGLFSEGEIAEITKWITEKEAEGKISIRVFAAEMDLYYEKYFVEECADRLCDNDYASGNLVIMLINMDAYDRGVCIQSYGSCEERINDDRTEYILDDILEYFGKEDFVYGTKLFATEAAHYAQSEEFADYYKDNSFEGKMKRMPWGVLVVAPAVVAIVGILLMKHNAGGKMTACGRTYIASDNSGLTAKRDDFVRSSVTKTYSPQSSGGSSSGGRSSGGGGRSRGGRSHSGGSRRF